MNEINPQAHARAYIELLHNANIKAASKRDQKIIATNAMLALDGHGYKESEPHKGIIEIYYPDKGIIYVYKVGYDSGKLMKLQGMKIMYLHSSDTIGPAIDEVIIKNKQRGFAEPEPEKRSETMAELKDLPASEPEKPTTDMQPPGSMEQLKALADIPETITIGKDDYGETFDIYPMTPGKLALLDDKMTAFAPMLGYLDVIGSFKNKDEEGGGPVDEQQIGEARSAFVGKIKDSVEPLLDAFFILTSPNNGKPPEKPSEERREEIKFKLDIPQLMKILLILKQQGEFGTMLKNELTLKAKASKSSTGQLSSVGLSSSQAGDETI